MNEWTNDQADEWINKWMNALEQTNEKSFEFINEQCINERIHEYMSKPYITPRLSLLLQYLSLIQKLVV